MFGKPFLASVFHGRRRIGAGQNGFIGLQQVFRWLIEKGLVLAGKRIFTVLAPGTTAYSDKEMLTSRSFPEVFQCAVDGFIELRRRCASHYQCPDLSRGLFVGQLSSFPVGNNRSHPVRQTVIIHETLEGPGSNSKTFRCAEMKQIFQFPHIGVLRPNNV